MPLWSAVGQIKFISFLINNQFSTQTRLVKAPEMTKAGTPESSTHFVVVEEIGRAEY